MRRLAHLTAFACLLGCGSTKLTGSGPHGADEFPAGSLAYYLGMDVVEIDLTLTYRQYNRVENKKVVREEELIGAAGTVALKTVADTGRLYALALDPGSLSQTDLNLSVGEDGLLQRVSVQAHGKAGEIIKNIATFAATLAGLGGAGVPAFSPSPFPTAEMKEGMGAMPREALSHPLGWALEEEKKLLEKRRADLTEQRTRAAAERDALEKRIGELVDAEKPVPAHTAALLTKLEGRLADVSDRLEEVDRLLGRVALQQTVVDTYLRTIHVSTDPRHADAVLLLQVDSQARDVYARILLFDARIEAARVDRETTRGFLSVHAREKTEVDALKLQLDTIQSAVTTLEAERASLQGRFDALLAAFRAHHKLGETRIRRKLRQVVRLTDLPADGAEPTSGAMQTLWEEAGVYLSLERVEGAAPAALAGTPSSGNTEAPAEDDTHVYYRRPVPAVVRLYSRFKEFGEAGTGDGPRDSRPVCCGAAPGAGPAAGKTPGAGSAAGKTPSDGSATGGTSRRWDAGVQGRQDAGPHLIGSYAHHVLLADTPASSVAFTANAFADRSLVLGFSGGRLVTVHQTSTSSAAGATAALSGGAQAARDEFDATLTKLKNIKTTQRDIGLLDLDTRIKELEKRKDIVDKEVALEGATATRELELERLKLQAEMLLLQKELELSTKRIGAEVHDEIEKLKAEISRLQQEQALTKLQREVEELKSPR